MNTKEDVDYLGVFDMFTLGIGPSSSHTVGPMRAGYDFAAELQRRDLVLTRVKIRLFGSLAATGIGHGTNRAVLLGLGGALPETVDTASSDQIIPRIGSTGELVLFGGRAVPFNLPVDLRFEPSITLPHHVNALTIDAWTGPDVEDEASVALTRTYYSTGGGFISVDDGGPEPQPVAFGTPGSQEEGFAGHRETPLPFASGDELLERCEEAGVSIAQVVRTNELAQRSQHEVDEYLDVITSAMFACVESGCETKGVLPGGLHVRRRAVALRQQLENVTEDPLETLDWVTLYALAVNEENASGHRVVTAPTNGAAGIIPAVLGYLILSRTSRALGGLEETASRYELWKLAEILDDRPDLIPLVRDFLLAATAIGSIIKTNASIAGAEVGCQGEVGSASAMAAAGLAQAFGGTPQQVENAAEIAMEHSLGLTCDPVGGLVQIPCIERNAVGAVKAISAARMALYGDGRHQVSLDVAVETMRQTGADMLDKYKETSIGGLAVNVVEC